MAKRVAFVGLGNMGGGMAANLVKGGFEVNAFDLSETATAQAKENGCNVVSSAIAAVVGVDFVVTMLPNGSIVESVYIGDGKTAGLLDAIPNTALILDCSTIAPTNARAVGTAASAKTLRFVDAPVSGGVAAAAYFERCD